MISGGQIAQGAITDNKVGKYANIKHSKLAKAEEGEFLVAQDNGRLEAVRLSGDATLSRSGKITVKFENDNSVKKSDFKENKTLVGGSTEPEEIAVGSGSNAIPKRDSSGNLQAEKIELVNELPTPSAGKVAYDGKFKVAESDSWDEVTTANNTQTLDNKNISGGLFTT